MALKTVMYFGRSSRRLLAISSSDSLWTRKGLGQGMKSTASMCFCIRKQIAGEAVGNLCKAAHKASLAVRNQIQNHVIEEFVASKNRLVQEPDEPRNVPGCRFTLIDRLKTAITNPESPANEDAGLIGIKNQGTRWTYPCPLNGRKHGAAIRACAVPRRLRLDIFNNLARATILPRTSGFRRLPSFIATGGNRGIAHFGPVRRPFAPSISAVPFSVLGRWRAGTSPAPR